VFICVLLTAGPVSGQWTHFDNNADIRSLYQRGDTLWVGTNGGVVLLDLLNNEILSKITAGPSLPDNSVRVIRGHGGDIYVGTDAGLAVNPHRDAMVLTRRDDVFYEDIRDVSWGIDDRMYVATFGHGVGVVEEDNVYRITREDSLLGDKVFAVAEVDTGRVYFATSLGLCAYRDSAWVGFQAGAGLPRGSIRQMIGMGADRFYVMIVGRGVYRFNHSRSVRIRTGEPLGEDDVSVITLGPDGSLWVGGRFGGIARYRRGAWETYGDDDADVAGAKWRCAYAGPNGDVFFGSADGLVVVVSGGNLRKIFIPSMLPSGHIGPIAEGADGRRYIVNGPHLLSSTPDSDRFALEKTVGSVFSIATSLDGQVWASTPWGLLRRQGGRWSEIDPVVEPTSPRFVSLAIDEQGHLWAGTHTGEVYRYDERFWVAFASQHELAAGPISRLLIDPHNTVWAVSGPGGIHRFDGTSWTTFGLAEFDSLRIRDAAVDGTGQPVAITERAVWRFDTGSGWSRLLTEDPMDIGYYRSICFDGMGRMYLGTTRGLALLGPEHAAFVAARDGLRGRDVTALLVDSEDNLWVGFRDNGISRISLEDLW
jgi:ligand-binding sensor domain-containing protein